jgi:hypothetical protein
MPHPYRSRSGRKHRPFGLGRKLRGCNRGRPTVVTALAFVEKHRLHLGNRARHFVSEYCTTTTEVAGWTQRLHRNTGSSDCRGGCGYSHLKFFPSGFLCSDLCFLISDFGVCIRSSGFSFSFSFSFKARTNESVFVNFASCSRTLLQ